MTPEVFDALLQKLTDAPRRQAKEQQTRIRTPVSIKKVVDKTLAYTGQHRDQFYRPEYDFDQIMIAESRDGYIAQSLQKKVNRVVVAGWNWTGNNAESVAYLRRRINEMSWATGTHFDELIIALFHDQFRFNNHFWVKVRDDKRSSGRIRVDKSGRTIKPVAGYFPLSLETLRLRSKPNGELIEVQQRMPDGQYRNFKARDLIHFHTNKNPGFSVGTPTILPALDDIALLRRIEENVEDLIESNLFPMFHYKVGNDQFPERYSPEGVKETDLVKKTIEYMPSGGVYVSDHRHEISRVGSEGAALRIDYYLQHFKNRALSSLGTSGLDMGEGSSANRSTASTLSKGMLMDIEAMALNVKRMIEFHVVSELLLEGGFDPFSDEDAVQLKFGVIDKEERRADENQQIQLWHANLQTMDETRKNLGHTPWADENMDSTFQKMFAEPLAMVKGATAGSPQLEALAGTSASNVEATHVESAKKFLKESTAQSASGAPGRPATRNATANATNAKGRPSNQHGTRSGPKTTSDHTGRLIEFPDGSLYLLPEHIQVADADADGWAKVVWSRHQALDNDRIMLNTVADSLLWRLEACSETD